MEDFRSPQYSLKLTSLTADKKYQEFLKVVGPRGATARLRLGWTPLIIFAAQGGSSADPSKIQVVDQLLAWSTDIHAFDQDGHNVLSNAICARNNMLVVHLIKRGANMRSKIGTNQLTAIQYAGCYEATGDKIPICEILMLRGAKPDEFKVNDMLNENVEKFYARIVSSRRTTTCLLGVRNRSPLLKLVGKDIMLQLAKAIYQTRGGKVWEQ
jgi:hypothetical protein